MINKVILIGNLGQDPELQKTNSGMSVVKLSIATARRGKTQETDWHNITCFGQTAENVAKYLSKGRRVYVEGRLQYSQWTDDKSGQKRKRAEIIADNITFLGTDTAGGGTGGSSKGGNEFGGYDGPDEDYGNDGGDEDIPF